MMVSVFCLAFNHAAFIRKTLDGFVMQKTDYRYEVFVHDDASTDNTAEIIQEYARDYPDIIKPIFQTENQYSKRVKIIKTYLLPRAQGKYFAWCDGDDYWMNPQKLQKQIEALEGHPSCSACLSKVQAITCDGMPKNIFFPRFKAEGGIISSENFIKRMLDPGPFIVSPVQWSGLMCKSELYRQYFQEDLDFIKKFSEIRLGDVPTELYLGLKGDIFYIDEVMSHYRTGNPNSHVGRNIGEKTNAAKYRRGKVKALEAFDADTNYYYHEQAEKAIAYTCFANLKLKNDVKTMKSESYRWLYDQLSSRQKVKYHLFYYLPWSERPVNMLSNVLKKKK